MFALSEARQRRIAVTERDAKSALLDVQLEHATQLSELVDVLIQRVDALEESARLALLRVEHLKRLRSLTPDEDLEVLQKLAAAFLELARIEWTARNPTYRDWPASDRALVEAEEILAILHAAGGHRPQRLYLQASINTHRGDHARHELKDYDLAEVSYLESLQGIQEALRTEDDNQFYLLHEGVTFANLGSVEAKRDNHEKALDHYQDYKVAFERLVDLQPSNPIYHRNLAVALGRCGNSSGKLGDAVAERGFLDRSLQVRKKLVEQFPEQNRQMRDVAWGHYFLARRLYKDGDTEDALHHLREHLGLIEQLAWLSPSDNRAAVTDVRIGHGNIALIPEYGGSESEQLEFYERFHERLLSPRVSYDPSGSASIELLLENIASRSALLLNMGRPGEAERLCAEGLELCESGLAGDEPGDSCTYLQGLQEEHFSNPGG